MEGKDNWNAFFNNLFSSPAPPAEDKKDSSEPSKHVSKQSGNH